MIFGRKKKEEEELDIEDIEKELGEEIEMEFPEEEVKVEERKAPTPKKAPEQVPVPEEYAQPSYATMEDVERLVEAIVEEKWKKVELLLAQFKSELDGFKGRLTEFEKRIAGFENLMKDLQTKTMEKLGEYTNDIKEVKVTMKALEKLIENFIDQFNTGMKELKEVISEIKRGV